MIDPILIFDITLLAAFILMILSLPFLRLTLTRRLKREIVKKEEFYHDSGISDFDLINTIHFATACAIPKMKKLKRHKYYVSENINVGEFANWYETILAFTFVLSMVYLVSASAIYYFVDLFGLIDANN